MKRWPLYLAIFLPLVAACEGGGTSGTGVITASSDLEAGPSVCGTVMDQTGAPMSSVTVQTALEREAVETDPDGQFMLDISAGESGAEIVVADQNGEPAGDAVVDVQPCDGMNQTQTTESQ